MKSEHDRLRERTHFGLCIATETADMHRALEEFSAATQAYTLYQESDKVDDHYHSEVCFEGGIWASDFQNECTGTGYLWYSCSENRQKFRLDVYSDATIEEITYDQHCDQIQRQAKFKNVISEIRHPNHPYRKMNSDERKVYLAKRLAEEGF
jgi:hypothetical protein